MALFNRNPLDWDTLSPQLKGLIGANLAVYALQWVLGYRLLDWFALTPRDVTHELHIWQLGSYMFLHGGLLHLFFNMLMLWMFGSVLESQWGPRELLRYYFICGVGAGITSVLLGWGSSVPTIGASGAIFGLLVAFAMVFPEAVVYVWFFIPMRARTMAIVFGVLELFMTMNHSRSGVSGIAHIGGMVTGFLYLKYGWQIGSRLRYWGRVLVGAVGGAPSARKRRAAAPPASPPDDLETEVNRILDKVLVQGADSLTPEEREIMKRYAKRSQR